MCGQANGKGMLLDDLLWLFGHICINFSQFDVLGYFLGSLREDVPHRAKLDKMAKIKVCKSSCIFRNMYGGPHNDPPMSLNCQTCKKKDLSCCKDGLYEVIRPPLDLVILIHVLIHVKVISIVDDVIISTIG